MGRKTKYEYDLNDNTILEKDYSKNGKLTEKSNIRYFYKGYILLSIYILYQMCIKYYLLFSYNWLKIHQKMKSLIILSFIIVLTSCSSYNYSTREQRKNNTIRIESDNLNDYKVVSKDKHLTKTLVRNGVALANYSKIKKKTLTLYLVHENYDSIQIDARRVIRKKALIKDVSLGVFTFGIPLIIDVFKSDFYKISPDHKEFKVHFMLKQAFMLTEYNKIKGSTKPDVFQNWIDNYDHSNFLQQVIDYKDSLELNIALSKESEQAIDNFIQSHQQSNFLSEAEKIKDEMVEARKLFGEVKKENTVSGFEKFLSKFPKSLHNKEAHKLLVYSAIKEGKVKNNLESMLLANSQYLLKFKGFLSNDELKKKTKEVSLKVDGILIKKLLNSKKNNYDTYSEFWKTYVKVKKENKNLTDLSRSLNKNKNIANLLIRKLYELKSETAQGKFIEQAKIDFPYLDGQTYNNSPTIKNIVQLADNFTGTLKLKNQGYLINHLKNSYEGDVYKNLKGFTYKNQNYNQTYKKGNVEKITMKNGQVTQLIVLEGSKKIIDAKFKLNRTRQTLKYKSISFFIDGKLVKTEFSNINNVNYFYEFENGKNLSLIELEKKVKEADQVLNQANYDRALDLYVRYCKNDYPKTISLNKRITKSINKTQVKRIAYLEKIESERIVRERKKGLLTSGNFDNELDEFGYIKNLTKLYMYSSSTAKKDCDLIFNKYTESVLGHKLNRAEKKYLQNYIDKKTRYLENIASGFNTISKLVHTCNCCNKKYKGTGYVWNGRENKTNGDGLGGDYCSRKCAVKCK